MEHPTCYRTAQIDGLGFQHNRVRNHRIVERISVLGDVEILLDFTRWVGEEGPVGTDTAAIFVRLSDIVGADRDCPCAWASN